jgi:hypothetical protein
LSICRHEWSYIQEQMRSENRNKFRLEQVIGLWKNIMSFRDEFSFYSKEKVILWSNMIVSILTGKFGSTDLINSKLKCVGLVSFTLTLWWVRKIREREEKYGHSIFKFLNQFLPWRDIYLACFGTLSCLACIYKELPSFLS